MFPYPYYIYIIPSNYRDVNNNFSGFAASLAEIVFRKMSKTKPKMAAQCGERVTEASWWHLGPTVLSFSILISLPSLHIYYIIRYRRRQAKQRKSWYDFQQIAAGGAKLRRRTWRAVKWHASERYNVIVSTTTTRLCPKGETTKRKSSPQGRATKSGVL